MSIAPGPDAEAAPPPESTLTHLDAAGVTLNEEQFDLPQPRTASRKEFGRLGGVRVQIGDVGGGKIDIAGALEMARHSDGRLARRVLK